MNHIFLWAALYSAIKTFQTIWRTALRLKRENNSMENDLDGNAPATQTSLLPPLLLLLLWQEKEKHIYSTEAIKT